MNDSEGVKCAQKHLYSDGNAAIHFNQWFSNGIRYNIYGIADIIVWTVALYVDRQTKIDRYTCQLQM